MNAHEEVPRPIFVTNDGEWQARRNRYEWAESYSHEPIEEAFWFTFNVPRDVAEFCGEEPVHVWSSLDPQVCPAHSGVMASGVSSHGFGWGFRTGQLQVFSPNSVHPYEWPAQQCQKQTTPQQP